MDNSDLLVGSGDSNTEADTRKCTNNVTIMNTLQGRHDVERIQWVTKHAFDATLLPTSWNVELQPITTHHHLLLLRQCRDDDRTQTDV